MKKYLLSRKMLTNLLVLALLGGWYVTLGPTAFGGPAAYVEVSGHSMDGTYKTGDLILTQAQDSYAVGDIVTYKVNGNQQVIHRIIGGDGAKGYTMQGDNNPDADPWRPTDADVVGKSWHRFEGKAWLLHLPQRPWFIGLTAGLLTLLVLGLGSGPRRPEDAEDSVEAPADGAPEDFLTAVGLAPAVPAQRTDSTPALTPALTSSPTRRQRIRSRATATAKPDGTTVGAEVANPRNGSR
jgi:signal peptidase